MTSKICQHWSAGKCNRGAACRFQHVGAGGTAAPKPAPAPPPDPAAAAEAWVRACVAANGPILASMVGRLYREAHGRHFADACGVTLNRFLRGRLAAEVRPGQRLCAAFTLEEDTYAGNGAVQMVVKDMYPQETS